MNTYCIKCPKFTDNNIIKTGREIDGKTNLYSRYIDYGFKNQNLLIKKNQVIY